MIPFTPDHAENDVHVQARLAYYRDLSEAERRVVDAHCAICAECRATREAYTRQDVVLAALPEIRARRDLRPQRLSRERQALVYFGDALALGGLIALLWLFALQLQAASLGLTPGAVTPDAPEPGVTIPPATLGLPSPWLPALPWLGAALLGVGTLFILSPRNPRLPFVGAVLSAVLLTSFVPPFSLVPNPAGVIWRIAGGYSYDPRLPFRNEFLIADAPERTLKPYLDSLIGAVGLSPLDPGQPLARYEILRVGLDAHHARIALVTTRFVYADGRSRIYPVPLARPAEGLWGFWLYGWQDDGLGRLRAEHLALPGQPFSTATSPIRLGAVQRLELSPAAERLDEINPGHWLWSSVRVQRMVWATHWRVFLIAEESAPGLRQLWLVHLDGSPPVAVTPPDDIREYTWMANTSTVVYTRVDPAARALDATHPFAIMAVGLPYGIPTTPISIVTGLASAQLPGMDAGEDVWFVSGGQVWESRLEPNQARQPIQGLASTDAALPPRPSPDGQHLAYVCGARLCMRDPWKNRWTEESIPISGQIAEAVWSPDNTRLAVIDRDPNDLRPVRLVVVGADGTVVLARDIAPGAAVDAPQWTPDGGAIFVQTYPYHGRRIIAVDVASGQVLDLSREHWDAYFALAPDGQSLLLNNGRGDFWTAEVVRER